MSRVIRFLVLVTVLVGVWSAFGGSALAADSPCATPAGNLPYQGGPVQHAPTFYAVYWLPSGPGNYHFEPLTLYGDGLYEARMNQFLIDVSRTNLANVVSQYCDAQGSVNATQSTFGGSWVDTTRLPPGTDGTKGQPLQDSDIANEAERAVATNHWQIGVNATVFVFTPSEINMCFGGVTSSACTPEVNSPSTACGDHSSVDTPDGPLVYAALPDADTLGGDSKGIGCSGTAAVPLDDIYADTEITFLAHELFEAETDPLAGDLEATSRGWFDPNGDTTNSEIGDKCVGDYGHRPWAVGPSGYNVDGRLYNIQQMWSNVTGECEGSNPVVGYFQVYGPFVATANARTGAIELAKTGVAPDEALAAPPTMDWGDGSPTERVRIGSCSGVVCSLDTDGHTYATPGVYEMTLTFHEACCITHQVHIFMDVFKNSQWITFSSNPPSPAVVGGTYTPRANSTSALPVTFSIGFGAEKVCSLDPTNTTVSFTRAGQCVVDAYQAGNAVYRPTTVTPQTFTVVRASQTVAFTSAPSGAVFGGTYTPAATATSGLPVTFSIDPSAAEVCSIDSSGTVVTFTGVSTPAFHEAPQRCVVDANQPGNTSYGPAAQQQSFLVGPATLTVTADSQSRQFGATNPPLTATITGFVLGQTLANSGVSGSPSCATPALAASPGGSYPVTCTNGTLRAETYTFKTFNPGSLTVTYTTTITGTHSGPLTVANGQSVLVAPGATVTGPVTVRSGGALDVETATITGKLQTPDATGAVALRACNSTVGGKVEINHSSGLVLLGDDEIPPWAPSGASCGGNNISAPVDITNNSAGVEFNDNTVEARVTITGNSGTLPPPDTGTVEANGNTISGPVNVQH